MPSSLNCQLLDPCECAELMACHRHDQSGSSGIHQIFSLLARFLSPTFSESGGVFVGELIMHLFRKAGGAIGPVLPDLLRAIVERLAVAKLQSFITVSHSQFAMIFLLAD